MKTHGTLIKWNDDRGFGFIALPQSGEEVFVHISAFPKDDGRPRIGEMISFEVRTCPDGRKRVEHVVRPGARLPTSRSGNVSAASERSPLRAALTIIVVGAIGFAAYSGYTSRHSISNEAAFAIPQTVKSNSRRFTCDGRTHCSQMTSCEEAVYFLQHCPGTQMDGDNDGEPCEQQWCN